MNSPNFLDRKTKTIIILSVVFIAIIVGFSLFYYYKGKAKNSIAPLIKDNPNSTDPNNNPAGVDDSTIKIISENLYSEMKGSNLSGHNAAPYQALLELSDTDFERVYNQFNTDHQGESSETLTQWVNDQWSGWLTDFDGLKKAILARCAKLNLV